LSVAVFSLVAVLPSAGAADKLTADEAAEIATAAYIYGYSLITTNVTRVRR